MRSTVVVNAVGVEDSALAESAIFTLISILGHAVSFSLDIARLVASSILHSTQTSHTKGKLASTAPCLSYPFLIHLLFTLHKVLFELGDPLAVHLLSEHG